MAVHVANKLGIKLLNFQINCYCPSRHQQFRKMPLKLSKNSITFTFIQQTQAEQKATMQSAPTASSTEQQKQQKLGSILKEIATEALEMLRKASQSVDDLQIAFNAPQIKQGKNFIGRFDGSIISGTALYFKKNTHSYDLFIGQLIEGQPIKKGVKIELSLNDKKTSQDIQVEVNFSKFDALLLYNWQSVEKVGYYICKNGKKQTHFKGQFNENLSMKEGMLEQKQSGALVSRYDGKFQNNQFHGYGKIHVPCQYQYEGRFYRNNKQGLGREQDIARKTTYVGHFSANEKDGYGQIFYEGKKSLKGFWENGIMGSGQGVFADEKGNAIETYDKRYIPII